MVKNPYTGKKRKKKNMMLTHNVNRAHPDLLGYDTVYKVRRDVSEKRAAPSFRRAPPNSRLTT
jgi:hypothetical protein